LLSAFYKEKHCVFDLNLVIINAVYRVFFTLGLFYDILSDMAAQTIGYLRVSTADQDLEKNKADILMLANHHNLGQVRFVEEKVSGKVSWHKRLIAQIIADLKKGDSLVVSEMSRLGRSMLECMEILSIAMERGVHVYSVKGNWRLDQSIQSKIVAMAFSMAAEIERDLISQRTKEALRVKKPPESH